MPGETAGYSPQLTLAGLLLTPPGPGGGNFGATPKFVCPVTLTSSIVNFNLKNVSFTMEAYPVSGAPARAVCQLVLDTVNSAMNIVNAGTIDTPLGGNGGASSASFSAVNRAHLSCWVESGTVRINRYTASMTYYE